MTKQQHTPKFAYHNLEIGSDRHGFFIRFLDAAQAYEAQRIINAHDELVAALREALHHDGAGASWEIQARSILSTLNKQP